MTSDIVREVVAELIDKDNFIEELTKYITSLEEIAFEDGRLEGYYQGIYDKQ